MKSGVDILKIKYQPNEARFGGASSKSPATKIFRIMKSKSKSRSRKNIFGQESSNSRGGKDENAMVITPQHRNKELYNIEHILYDRKREANHPPRAPLETRNDFFNTKRDNFNIGNY